jgi:Family of unknown function (DUF6069)
MSSESSDARLYHSRQSVRMIDRRPQTKEKAIRDRRHRRIATAVLAPAAALAAWAGLRLGDVEFTLKSGDTVGALDVVTTALVGAVVGWLVLRAIERHTPRPRATWTVVATTALAVSVIGPSLFADGGSAAALIALHIVTAAVVIAGFAGTVPLRRPAAGAAVDEEGSGSVAA